MTEHANETMGERLLEAFQEAKDHLAFILIALLIMIAIVALTIFLEKKLFPNTKEVSPNHAKKGNAKRIAGIGVFAAIGGVLTTLEIPLFVFYNLDFSEVPALLAGFLMGPTAGMLVEFIKVFIHILFHGTHSAFVGEFAMFVTGSLYVLPASFFYLKAKSKKRALLSLLLGSGAMVILGALFNGFYLIPEFADLYGVPIDALVGQLQETIPAVKGLWTIVAFATVPFNLIKTISVSAIIFFIYKPLSRLYRKIG